MKNNILWGVGIAGMLAVGLSAQTQPQTPPQDQYKSSTDDRKVTVQGCLERDYLYSPSTTGTAAAGTNTSPTPFKLTQVDVIKDEKVSADTGMKGAATATGSAVATGAEKTGDAAATGATKTADAVTGKQTEQKPKDKDIELHVAAAPTASVDLDSQVNHKVELVGMMSSKDLTSAKGKSSSDMSKMPLMFKATSVKSIADKCQ